MVSSDDTSGTREHLTASQTKILYKLWRRFFRLCEMPAGYASSNVTTTTSANTSVPDTGDALVPTPSSPADGEQQAPGTSSSTKTRPTHAATASSTSVKKEDSNDASAQSTSYGKPIQRNPSRSHQIDEHGSHIPKDDKVKDELKTIEEAKEMREFLEKYGGEKLREIFWDMVKGEHPDAIMLRFLRARKWDIDRAIAVIGSTVAFRADNNVKEIVKGGELSFFKTKGAKKILLNGISYIYGATSIGEPVYFIEVGNHFSHNQTQEELKRGVILLQEHMQMMMPPPIERKIVIFNMNDFGIRNMDWWCVFFMVKTMESYYVETLARVYVHGAPWIFRPIWAILKPLLDPVVRDKVRLTFSAEELAEHVPFDHLPKTSMRGGMDWDFEYPIPEEHENDIQLDTQAHDRYFAEFDRLATEFEISTKKICQLYTRSSLIQRARDGAHQDYSSDSELDLDDGEDRRNHQEGKAKSKSSGAASSSNSGTGLYADEIGADLKANRDVIATRLRVAFLRLKPYVVGKSMQERWNALRVDGSIHWEYPKLDGTVEKQVLGQGTTLHELERNLELIDQAQSNHSFHQQDLDGLKDFNSTTQQANNRQKRVMSRVKADQVGKEEEREEKSKDEQEPTPVRPPPLPFQEETNGKSGQSNVNSNSTITPGDKLSPMKDSTANDSNTTDQLQPVPAHPLGGGGEVHKSVS